ncbi:MAG: hypothetical protein M1369_02430 [Deinococcus sp.]|nr:hypothetical protein [Deinococcus sp.]MCL5964630.1 hypothetical protein [Deinococcus sp.]
MEGAYWIWGLGLVIAYLAIPLLAWLLLRILRAALKIERYARASRQSTLAINKHLNNIAALEVTEAGLKSANALAKDVATSAEALANLLARRAGGGA